MTKFMKELIEKDVNEVMSDELMDDLMKMMRDDGVKMETFDNLYKEDKDELKRRLIPIAPLYRIDLETMVKRARKINRELDRIRWEEENDDLIGTDKDPFYVEDMKSGKYKNKKDYYWKKYGVGISEND